MQSRCFKRKPAALVVGMWRALGACVLPGQFFQVIHMKRMPEAHLALKQASSRSCEQYLLN